MSRAPRVCVVTINWNGKEDTLACLESLRHDRYANKEIVVVDHGSIDGSVSAIRAQFPDVTVLEMGRNLGFTGGNNAGLRYAEKQGHKYLYWLNNDTTSEPTAVGALVAAANEDAGFGILTPVIYYFDEPNKPWFAGSRIDLRAGVAVHDNMRVPNQAQATVEIPWASGCAMFASVSLMSQLGGFDDRYFLNWEDVDLCIRTKAAGYRIGVVPAGRIFHKVNRTFASHRGAARYYYVRNNLLLVETHATRGRKRALLRVVASQLHESLREMRDSRGACAGSLIITLRAFHDHLLRRYGPRFSV